MTPSAAAPGDTDPSDATDEKVICVSLNVKSRIFKVDCDEKCVHFERFDAKVYESKQNED